MNHTLFFFFINICTVMFFPENWTKTELFLSCLQIWHCQTHLQYTKAHSSLGDQIVFTVGHGAPGTCELMNYHLLHIKCHGRFMPLEQDDFSIFATRRFLNFLLWYDNVISLPTSIGNWNQNFLDPKIPLAYGYKKKRSSLEDNLQIYISPVCLLFLIKYTDTDTDIHLLCPDFHSL